MEDKIILKYCKNCKKDFLGSKRFKYCEREDCIKQRNKIRDKKYLNSKKGKLLRSKINKRFRSENKEKLNDYSRQWRKNNPEKSKKFREQNPNYQNEWRSNNLEKSRATELKYASNQRKNNEHYKIKQNVARRIRELLGSSRKGLPTEKILGCTIAEFKLHLENQFFKRYQYKFNWKDYTADKFHIDHIRPCASFNLTIGEELLECFNYRNQELLTARENLVKSDKYNNLYKSER